MDVYIAAIGVKGCCFWGRGPKIHEYKRFEKIILMKIYNKSVDIQNNCHPIPLFFYFFFGGGGVLVCTTSTVSTGIMQHFARLLITI